MRHRAAVVAITALLAAACGGSGPGDANGDDALDGDVIALGDGGISFQVILCKFDMFFPNLFQMRILPGLHGVLLMIILFVFYSLYLGV